MSTSDPIPKTSAPAGRQARRYRLAGIIVLLVGCAAAGGVYWAGTRGPDVSEDAAMTGFNQGEERQKVADLFKVGRKTLYRALAA